MPHYERETASSFKKLQNLPPDHRLQLLEVTAGREDSKMTSKSKNTALIEQARTFKNVPWCEDYEKMISGML